MPVRLSVSHGQRTGFLSRGFAQDFRYDTIVTPRPRLEAEMS